jgi:cold shock CspA family protein
MAQGTIKSYDAAARSGVILDDARTELSFDAQSFAGSGLRMLRLGQRVRYTVEGEGERARISNLNILTLH